MSDVEAIAHKGKKKRSPPYPTSSLDTAISRVETLYNKEDQHWAPAEALAEHWQSNTNSSSFQQAISTLKQFGLLDDQGSGDARRFRVSDLALDILVYDPEKSEPHDRAIKTAALHPKLHKELWEKYGGKLPSDASLRVYLTKEREENKFNKSHVNGFIEQFKATIAFAKLSDEDTIGGVGKTQDEDNRKSPAIGDYVQWTSGGTDRFQIPKQVEAVSDDGIWALLQGEKTGVPMDELTVVDPPSTLASRLKAGMAANRAKDPFAGQNSEKGPTITFPLPNGNQIEIRLAKRVSKKDFDKIKKLVDLSEDSLVESDGEDEQKA